MYDILFSHFLIIGVAVDGGKWEMKWPNKGLVGAIFLHKQAGRQARLAEQQWQYTQMQLISIMYFPHYKFSNFFPTLPAAVFSTPTHWLTEQEV